MPVTELTVEQQFKMRQIEDAIKSPAARKDDLITIYLALQRQNFVLGNNIKQLLAWGTDRLTTSEDESKFGIS